MNNKTYSYQDKPNQEISSKRYLKTDAQNITNFLPNLESLIARDLIELSPEQVPNLKSINSWKLDIRLSDFPKLEEVFDHKKWKWKEISQRMKDLWYYYKNWTLSISPIILFWSELKYITKQIDIVLRNKLGFSISPAEELLIRYWDTVRDIVYDDPEAKVSTCLNSSFFREPNISMLSENILLSQKSKEWNILNIGCWIWPEPYQLGMQLMENKIKFNITWIDINEDVIKKVRKWTTDLGMKPENFTKSIEDGIAFPTYKNTYQLQRKLMNKMDFQVHDIVSWPFWEEKRDVIICNNLLQHFTTITRNKVIKNILSNLKEWWILALEHNHFSFRDKEEEKWLTPYYRWKKMLWKHWLYEERIENLDTPWKSPVIIYRYKPIQKRIKKLLKNNIQINNSN